MRAFLEANDLPAGAAFRRQDALDNDSPSYVGDVGIGINPKLAARVREADVLLVVGPRLGEMTTSGYTLLEPPTPKQILVHVHPGAEELSRVYQPALQADPLQLTSLLGAVESERGAETLQVTQAEVVYVVPSTTSMNVVVGMSETDMDV